MSNLLIYIYSHIYSDLTSPFNCNKAVYLPTYNYTTIPHDALAMSGVHVLYSYFTHRIIRPQRMTEERHDTEKKKIIHEQEPEPEL